MHAMRQIKQGASVLPKKEESGVLMVMNLPDSLTDEHVRELLSPFGELKRFNLLKVMRTLMPCCLIA